jgi:hypothetical protein
MATTKLGDVYPIIIDKYESFIPLNGGVDMIEKINSVVEHLNRLGQLTTETVNQWNKVMKWVNADGLTDSVNAKIDDLIAKGLFDELLNGMMDDLNADVTDFKNTVNGQVDGLTSQLADKAKQSDLQKRGIDVTNPPAPLTPAKLDGVTDDGPVIQAIMNYCIQNGRAIYFPNGIANIATGIVVDGAQATSDGAMGTNATKFSIKTESKFGTKLVAANSTVNILTLKNMSVHMSGLWFKSGNVQLELDKMSECHFEDITFNGGLIGTQFGLGTFDNLFERCYWITFPDPNSIMINMPVVTGDSINNTTFISCHLETCGGTMVKMYGDTSSGMGRHSYIVFYNTHFETRFYSGKILDVNFVHGISFEDCNFIVNNQWNNESATAMTTKFNVNGSTKTMFHNCNLTYPPLSTTPTVKPFKVVGVYGFTIQHCLIYIPQTVYPTMASCIDYSGQTNLSGINWQYNRCNTLETSTTTKDVRMTDHFVEQSNKQFILRPTTNSGSGFPILNLLTSTNGGQAEGKMFGVDAYGGLSGGFCQTVTNGSTASFYTGTTENSNMRGLYFITVNAPADGYAIIFSSGAGLYTIGAGSVFSIPASNFTTNPNVAGKFNVYLSGNTLQINNQYGSDRTVNITHISFR